MKIVKKNKTYFINLESLKEERDLEPYLNKILDVNKISSQEVLFSLREKIVDKKKVIERSSLSSNLSEDKKNLVKNKIASLLNDKNLTFQDKVEGSFEKLLNKEDLKVFKEMILNKEVETFKLSEKYKKGVYQITSKNHNLIENNNSDFSEFNNNGYMVLKNTQDAKNFSKDFEDDIKSGFILGIKSFDGNYYILKKELFDKLQDKVKSLDLKGSFSLENLSSSLKSSSDLIKVFIEILKEEGKVIEKRKEMYEFID